MKENKDMQSLYEKAVQVCIEYDNASASLLQRKLRIGYAQASGIIDLLEKDRIICKLDSNSLTRKVLVSKNNKNIEHVKKPLRWFLFRLSETLESLAYKI
jgi:DNA segregation ATPase FtsK/SpoIIIE-like protein